VAALRFTATPVKVILHVGRGLTSSFVAQNLWERRSFFCETSVQRTCNYYIYHTYTLLSYMWHHYHERISERKAKTCATKKPFVAHSLHGKKAFVPELFVQRRRPTLCNEWLTKAPLRSQQMPCISQSPVVNESIRCSVVSLSNRLGAELRCHYDLLAARGQYGRRVRERLKPPQRP
jgi:hypothetical protein